MMINKLIMLPIIVIFLILCVGFLDYMTRPQSKKKDAPTSTGCSVVDSKTKGISPTRPKKENPNPKKQIEYIERVTSQPYSLARRRRVAHALIQYFFESDSDNAEFKAEYFRLLEKIKLWSKD